jgi:general secretion pathway protein L
LVAATLAAYLAAVRHADLADATARLEAARAALEARQREAEADAGAQDILAPKYAGLPLVLLIDQLSAAVPGDTYLTELVAEEGRVRFSGLSADAGALITSIEDRTALDEVRFGASVIYDEAAQAERFEIQGRIGGGRS